MELCLFIYWGKVFQSLSYKLWKRTKLGHWWFIVTLIELLLWWMKASSLSSAVARIPYGCCALEMRLMITKSQILALFSVGLMWISVATHCRWLQFWKVWIYWRCKHGTFLTRALEFIPYLCFVLCFQLYRSSLTECKEKGKNFFFWFTNKN